MEIESRSRRTATTTPTTTSELFICFTSRLSHSSSMRLSSKSILSPGHSSAGDKSASLSASLSRRLRHNGSLRQSPAMFPSKKTRGGPGFDNPEPSSPKVTCIGQVRVKTKKQGKKMKMRASKRLSSAGNGGEASFRRIEGLMRQNSSQDSALNQRNQRWVHLPLTICEALRRAFGSEFSCLLPCKSSSCFSTCGGGGGGGGGGERDKGKDSGEFCGGVFRWLVTFQDGEGEGRERDIELVVEEEQVEERIECSSRRRSIFDDMEFKDEIFHVGKQDEAARVSVCVPPKNALLLMRCRSDPAKMSALSNKISEPPLVQHSNSDSDEREETVEEEDEAVEDEVEVEIEVEAEEEKQQEEEIGAKMEDETEEINENLPEIQKVCLACVAIDANEMGSEELGISSEEKQDEEEEGVENRDKVAVLLLGKDDENDPYRCSIDAITIRKMFEEKPDPDFINDETKTVEMGDICSSPSSSCSTVQESTAENQRDEENVKSIEKAKEEEEEELSRPDPIPSETLKEVTKKVLPDCLLLMMCEPKLSMEVSKETWVCSTDFIRWLPERHHTKKPTKTDASDEPKKKRKPPAHSALQPGRSSISFPTGGAEQKLVKTGVGYEPLVLPRCKSAPMRSTAKIAAPELACSVWRRENGRKVKPAAYGVGAAGVGC